MTGHVFISYSHHDQGYVARLIEHLRGAGLEPWTDEGIEHGAQWKRSIELHIETCAAFVPVMSDHSRTAAWVTREIDLAQELCKPILPIRLAGRRFLELRDLQDEDVTHGGMPGQAFVARLRNLAPGAADRQPRGDGPDELIERRAEATRIGEAGDPAGAVDLLRDLVSDCHRVFGPDHVETICARHDFSYYMGESGDPDEAVRLLREVVPDLERVLGPDHTTTLLGRLNLAHDVGEAGDPAQAARLLRDLASDYVRVVGSDEPKSLRCRLNLAYYTERSGDRAAAIPLYREVLAAYTRALGPDHPETTLARDNLDLLGG